VIVIAGRLQQAACMLAAAMTLRPLVGLFNYHSSPGIIYGEIKVYGIKVFINNFTAFDLAVAM